MWPGILVLIGVSMLVRGMVPAAPREVAARPAERMEQAALDGREHEDAEGDEWEDDVAETPAFMVDDSEKKARHRSDLLPTEGVPGMWGAGWLKMLTRWSGGEQKRQYARSVRQIYY